MLHRLDDTVDRYHYMDILLLADESVEMISEYINDGDMYLIKHHGQIVGVCVFTFHPNYVVEIKNLALIEAFRGIGIGKSVIQEAFPLYRQKGYHTMIVGTANSSIETIAFYQKAGFRMHEVIKNFFLSYPEAIYEDGIRALDMLVFQKDLGS